MNPASPGLQLHRLDHVKDPNFWSVRVNNDIRIIVHKTDAVMACDEDVIPSLHRIEAVGDDADLDDVYNTERHLLYVACTRAREPLLVTGTSPVSEFVDDLTVD